MPTTRTQDSFDPYSTASSRQRLEPMPGGSSSGVRYRDDASSRPTTKVDTAAAAPVREKSYVRPPDVAFGSVELDTDKGALDVSTPGAFTINLRIPISIRNPNFFDAGSQSLTAEAFYPVRGMADTPVGGGSQKNIVFKGGDSVSNTSFPIAITYDKAIDPTQA
ncbi:hypothetical protein AURDEDRAFT_177447, partial [Auricularia subglabra TFB-10046 SS5]